MSHTVAVELNTGFPRLLEIPPGFFFFKIPRPGKSWKLKFDILDSPRKIVATRCHTLRLKSTKFDFSWGSAPDPMLGELTVVELTALPQIP